MTTICTIEQSLKRKVTNPSSNPGNQKQLEEMNFFLKKAKKKQTKL